MDLAKFLSMVQTNSLFFARGDSFEDQFEGSYPRANVDDFGSPGDGYVADAWKRMVGVSCWYASEYESYAMWRLYTENKQGIAISTTVDKLRQAVKAHAHLQRVEYIDFINEKADIYTPLDVFHYKRRSFEHEKEVRAIISRLPRSKGIVDGMPVPGTPTLEESLTPFERTIEVDMEILLDSIVVSPYSPLWFHEVVNDVMKKYEVGTDKFKVSELSGDPAYATI